MNINEIQKNDVNNIFSDKKVSFEGQGKVSSATEGIFLGAYYSANDEKNKSDIIYGKNEGLTPENVNTDEVTTEADAMELISKLRENVTPESYSKMETLGLAPKEDEMGNIVTVNERIQIQLAAYCDDYAGSALSVNSADVKAVMGSAAAVAKVESSVKNAVAMAGDIQKFSETGKLPETAKAYLLKNSMEPTIANTYKAVHSSVGSNPDVEKISDTQWESMKPQVAAIYTEAGIAPEQNVLEEGRWMIENNIPLTKENVLLASHINSTDFDMTGEQITKYVEDGMAAGMAPEDVVLTEGGTILEKAENMVNTVNTVTRDDLNYIVTNNNELSFKALKEAKEAIAKGEKVQPLKDMEEQIKYAKAGRVILEAQLVMTVGSCVQMMKLGISADTMALSDVVDNLKNMEKDYYNAFLTNTGIQAQAADVSLMQETMYSVNYVSYQLTYNPYEFVGKAYENETKTLTSFTAMQLEATYAGVGTEVRKDLGDSIVKAFEHADTLLASLGIEANSANIKAARILGYNSLEINEQNITAIKNLSAQLDALTENLTPQTVAELIKNGVNVLNTEISVLNDNLEIINERNDKGTKEKYSKFLWKMDKTGELTEDERNAYIGMYRLINWVGKNDGNVIGALYKQGSEVNLKNLLMAARTKKVKGIDVSLDDKFGVTDQVTKLDDIERDINKIVTDTDVVEYAESLMRESGKVITPEGVSDILSGEMPGMLTPEQVYEKLANHIETQDMSYASEQLEDMKHLSAMSEETVKAIIDNNMPVTVNNLLSAGMLYGNTKGAFDKLRGLTDTSAVEEALLHGSEEELKEAIDNMAYDINSRTESLQTEVYPGYDYFKEAIFASNIMSTMANMSRNRNYVVESTINDKSTVIKLSVETGINHKVKLSYTNETYGEVKAELTIEGGVLRGIISVMGEEIRESLAEKLNMLAERLERYNFEEVNIKVAAMWEADSVALNPSEVANGENADMEDSNNIRLYDMAKDIIAWL
ncbi:MAG: hypothetical protein E7266_08515 [Lachnospiraceae bacterium]|nr:hypothetical protein [Lachnospiraceae bacterium]